MRIFLSVDMEGIAGVSGRDDVARGHSDYERFRKLMTVEANQAIRGAFDAGATSVIVNDSHGGMRNLLYEEIDGRAELISGHNKRLSMAEGAEGASAAIFIGYHAMAGTAHAALDHTISGARLHNVWMNGTRVGESQINAAILGHFGIPVLVASGDDQLAAQIHETLPGTRTVIVKYGIDHLTVRSLPRDEVHAMIREGVRDAVADRPWPDPHVLSGPFRFRLEFTRSNYAEVATVLPQVLRVDARTVEVTGDDIIEAWRMARGALLLGAQGET